MISIGAAIISAAASIIVGVLSFVGVVVSNSKSGKDMQHKLDKAQAVTDTRLAELTREVHMHNNFANRMPVVEEQIKVINHRIYDLETRERGTWQ